MNGAAKDHAALQEQVDALQPWSTTFVVRQRIAHEAYLCQPGDLPADGAESNEAEYRAATGI